MFTDDSLTKIINNLSRHGKIFYYGSSAVLHYKKRPVEIYRILTDVNLALISQFVGEIGFLKDSMVDFYTILDNNVWVTFLTEDSGVDDDYSYLKNVFNKYKSPFFGFFYNPVRKKYYAISENCLKILAKNHFLNKTDYFYPFEDILDLSLLLSEFNINSDIAADHIKYDGKGAFEHEKLKSFMPLIGKIFTLTEPYKSLNFFNSSGILEIIFPFLNNIKGIRQDRFLHPEGDVFEHTLHCFKFVKDPSLELFYGLLLHDYGKTITKTKKGFYGHSQIGAKQVSRLLNPLGYSYDFIKKIEFLVEYHMVNTFYYKLTDNEKNRFFNNELGLDLLRLFKADLLGSVGRLDSYLDILSDLRKIQKKSFRNKLNEEIRNFNLGYIK